MNKRGHTTTHNPGDGPAVTRRAFTVAGLGLSSLTVAGSLAGCLGEDESSVPDLPFTQLDGSQHRLTDFRNKVALINFWATSCTTCVKEMPQIVATHERFKARGFETLAVAMQYDPPAYVMQFAQSRQLPFRVAIDHTGALAQAFGRVQLTPTTLIVNKQGKVFKRYVGEPDFKALHALIDKLLAEA